MSDMMTRDPMMGAARTGDVPGDVEAREPRGDRSAFSFREPKDDESIGDLVRRLAEEGSHLAHQQVNLVETEVRSAVTDLKESAGAMAGAAVLGIAGIGVVLMGVSFLLGQAMPLWLATLIVGAATLVGAWAMFAGAKNNLESSSMSAERTRRTLERAPSAISGNTSEERRHDR